MVEYLLIEHIGGYELFELKSLETLSNVSFTDYMTLTQAVNHISSLPMTDVQETVSMIKNLEAGELPEKLRSFLEMNGVKTLHCDKSLKNGLKGIGIEQKESLSISRGVKMHLHKFIKKDGDARRLILGTALLLARCNIKYDLEREDNVAISVGFEVENIEKELEKLTEKANTLLGWYFPGVNSEEYLILSQGETEAGKSQGVIAPEDIPVASTPPGTTQVASSKIKSYLKNVPPEDLTVIKGYLTMISEKRSLIRSLESYLSEKLKVLSPNLREIVGDRLCFKMINKAGGLMNLCLYPSSTVQLLGAEKGLFRSLKAKTATPKHGMVYDAGCLDEVRGNKKLMGKMSRYVATKCSLAARIDSFGGERSGEYGRELRRMVEKRIKKLRGAKGEEETAADAMKRVQKRLKSEQ